MKDTKMSLCNTYAQIQGVNTIEQIINKIKGTNFKPPIERLREIVKKNGKNDKYNKEKEKLTGFCPSGEFNGKREINSFQTNTYSKILVLDIDALDNFNHAKQIKNKAAQIPKTLSVFISPSGIGCKILVKVDSEFDKHKQVYQQVMTFYSKELGVECDESCIDLSRFHYFSYDPDIYINWDSEIFKFGEPTINENPSNNKKGERVKWSEELTQKKLKFKDRRNDYIHLLACNLNRFSVPENIALEYCVVYQEKGFNESEILATVRGVYRRNKNEFGKFKDKPDNIKKKYDYVKIREDLGIADIKLDVNQYFSLLFQNNENEEGELVSYLLEDFNDIYQFFEDETITYFSNEIIKNLNFDNNIFLENPDTTISQGFKTLLSNEEFDYIDRKERILIADFKAEHLHKHYNILLKQQPFLTKKGISGSLNELSRIVKLFENQIDTSKAFLEDCFDNPL